MTTIEFEAWPKTTRLFRPVTVTEKIDGTNACIIFAQDEDTPDGYELGVQSRNRLITPWDDNQGFAQWVAENHGELFEKLSYGRHYGEWWGQKIGRKYNMTHRVFSIFNTDLWSVQPYVAPPKFEIGDAVLTSAPVLYRGDFDQDKILGAAAALLRDGSEASSHLGEDFDKPEGICIWHSQTRQVQKFTFDNNDKGKWESL